MAEGGHVDPVGRVDGMPWGRMGKLDGGNTPHDPSAQMSPAVPTLPVEQTAAAVRSASLLTEVDLAETPSEDSSSVPPIPRPAAPPYTAPGASKSLDTFAQLLAFSPLIVAALDLLVAVGGTDPNGDNAITRALPIWITVGTIVLAVMDSRSLQLAAETAAIPAFTLRRMRSADAELREHNAAMTRWVVHAIPSPPSTDPCMGRSLWKLKPLPLFAAADQKRPAPEIVEQPVVLRQMTTGREVVEDYSTVGLTLRPHPVTFLRQELTTKRIRPCRDVASARDGDRIEVAGLVLVRQRPGSAKGVMFITIEDKSDIANLVIWPKLFDRQRKTILSASMLGVWGKVQREGEVIHLVAHRLTDLSARLRSVGDRDQSFSLPHGRGDEAKTGGSGDQRDLKAKGLRARDIYFPALQIHSGMKVKTRDFDESMSRSELAGSVRAGCRCDRRLTAIGHSIGLPADAPASKTQVQLRWSSQVRFRPAVDRTLDQLRSRR